LTLGKTLWPIKPDRLISQLQLRCSASHIWLRCAAKLRVVFRSFLSTVLIIGIKYNIRVNPCTNISITVFRVLRPPGGGSSNLFGGYEEDTSASRRPNKMSSSIFAPAEESQGSPKRSNPPGELSSDSVFSVLGLLLSPSQIHHHTVTQFDAFESRSQPLCKRALLHLHLLSCHQ